MKTLIYFGLTLAVLTNSLGAAETSQVFKDTDGATIGYTQPVRPDKVYAKSADGVTLGWYNPQNNKTYDSSGKFIAEGDALSALIFRTVQPRRH